MTMQAVVATGQAAVVPGFRSFMSQHASHLRCDYALLL